MGRDRVVNSDTEKGGDNVDLGIHGLYLNSTRELMAQRQKRFYNGHLF